MLRLIALTFILLSSPALAKGRDRVKEVTTVVVTPVYTAPAPVVAPRPVQITSYWAGPTPIPTYSLPEAFGQ